MLNSRLEMRSLTISLSSGESDAERRADVASKLIWGSNIPAKKEYILPKSGEDCEPVPLGCSVDDDVVAVVWRAAGADLLRTELGVVGLPCALTVR